MYLPGTIYTGGSDGRIFAIKDRNLTLIGRTGIKHDLCGTFELEPQCGRPKGMKVGPDGHLYIVDAYKGLLKIDLPDFRQQTLISSEKGKNTSIEYDISEKYSIDFGRLSCMVCMVLHLYRY